MLELTQDCILNGKIKLLQPKDGYRVAIDPIILASFVDISQNQKILDVGCGVGTISLILKRREDSAELTAIDIDKEICEFCKSNSRINNLNIEVINSNLEDINANLTLRSKLFDTVVTNPPFFEQKSFRISSCKRLANFETVELSDWISFCLKKLKNHGMFYIIHNASRVGDILRSLNGIAGSIEIHPIFSKKNIEAKRIVICCKKSSKSESKIFSGLVVHNDDGGYSKSMSAILSGSFYKSSR